MSTIIEAISLERFRERRARGQTGAEAGNHHHYRAILFRLWYMDGPLRETLFAYLPRAHRSKCKV